MTSFLSHGYLLLDDYLGLLRQCQDITQQEMCSELDHQNQALQLLHLQVFPPK